MTEPNNKGYSRSPFRACMPMRLQGAKRSCVKVPGWEVKFYIVRWPFSALGRVGNFENKKDLDRFKRIQRVERCRTDVVRFLNWKAI